MFSKLSALAVAGAAPVLVLAAAAQAQDQPYQQPTQQYQQQSQTSMTCRFDNGPRAGQVVDLTGQKHAKAVNIGEPCTDGKSTGVAVAPGEAGAYGAGTPHYTQAPEGYSYSCAFNKGPRAGQTVDLTGQKHAKPVRIGEACSSGKDKGVAVAPGGEAPPSQP